MGNNCSSRESPYDIPQDATYWRKCGSYNDWLTNDKFCTPLFGNDGNDSAFCNWVGGENEWRLRTPAHQQSKDDFISGNGNSVEALQTVIDRSQPTLSDIQTAGEKFYDDTVEKMRKNIRANMVNPSDNKDMGPLYGQGFDGGTLPLWENWFNNYSDDEFPKCTYNDWRKDGKQSSGCCAEHYLSCGIIDGMNVTCLRNSFKANEDEFGSISCCFNDLVCEPGAADAGNIFAPRGQDGENTQWYNNNKCFRSNSDDDMRTCDPLSRDLGNNFCGNLITPYCTGEKLFPGQANWLDNWDENSSVNVNEADFYKDKARPVIVKSPCIQLLMRQMSGQYACGKSFDEFQINPATVSIEGMLNAKKLIDIVFNKYLKEYGSPILGINEDGLEAAIGVNNFLFNLCQKFPALCQDSLYKLCKDVTEEQLIDSQFANNWCGCYMPEEQYEKYTGASFLVTKQCTPFCSRNDVIPLVDSNYQPLYCQQNICIMNDVYLRFVKARGAVNFNEVCNNCGKNSTTEQVNGTTNFSNSSVGTNDDITRTVSTFNSYSNNQTVAQTCSCTLDNLTFEAIDSEFNNINFATNCGNTTCTDSEGRDIACSGKSDAGNQYLPEIENNIKEIKNLKSLKLFKKIFILGLIILFLFSLFYIFFGNKKKTFIDSAGQIINLKKGQKFSVNNGVLTIKN